MVLLDGEKPFVGDGDAMGVAADVFEDLFRSGKGPLAEDDPPFAAQLSEEVLEFHGMLELFEVLAFEVELVSLIGLP